MEKVDEKLLEFDRLFGISDISGLEIFLNNNTFHYKNLLYEKLLKCDDNEKIKKFIEEYDNILDEQNRFDLLLEKFENEEVHEILLRNPNLLIANIERIFFEEKINPVELMREAINSIGDDIIKHFLNSTAIMISKASQQIKEILNIIGTSRIKEFINNSKDDNKIRRIVVLFRGTPFFREAMFDKTFNIKDKTKIDILNEVNDIDLFHECLERCELFGKEVVLACLKAIGDQELTLQFLCNDNFSFTDEEKIMTIFQFNNIEFTKRCIYDDRLKLEPMSKVIMLTKIPDKQYVKECIDDKSLGLNEYDIIFLKLFYEIGIEEYIESIKDNRIMLNTKKGSTKGIEIECGGQIDWYVVDIINIDESLSSHKMLENQKWKFEQDGSGIEISSYVMDDNEKATNTIYYACHLLKEAGQDVTEKDGAHVHIGDNILTNKQSYMNLLEIWLNLEKAMLLTSNVPGELPRLNAIGMQGYASPRSREMNDNIINGVIKLKGDETKEEFIATLRMNSDKFSSINLGNIGSEAGSTIEFRTPNGTLNPRTWIENINFFAALVQTAEALYQIQIKLENERTEKEKEALEFFRKIKTRGISEPEKMECLLRLIMDDEEQREIYRKRYQVNSKLLEKEENSKLKSEIDKRTATYFFGFDPIATGEYCFDNTDVELEESAYSRLLRDKENQLGEKGE